MDAQTLLRRFVEEDTALHAYVLAATGHLQDTEDILQTVHKVLWEKIDTYDETRPLRGWAIGVARMEVLKRRQHLARRRETLSDNVIELLAAEAVETGDELQARSEYLDQCLGEAPVLWRQVLVHKYYKRLTTRDISALVNHSVAGVEMILVRARRTLRKCVERKLQGVAAGEGVV